MGKFSLICPGALLGTITEGPLGVVIREPTVPGRGGVTRPTVTGTGAWEVTTTFCPPMAELTTTALPPPGP